ncbi:MAG: transporter, partial [Rhodobacterales bacterium 17-64-5]
MLFYMTLIPVLATVVGAAVAVWRRPGPTFVSATQHLAAGVVFATASSELLPDILHSAGPLTTLIGGGAGVLVMLGIRRL